MKPDTALDYLKARRASLFQELVRLMLDGTSEQRALVAAISELDADIQQLEREAA